tara:strand:+ start:299 stop:427 length:129 start_codon:yes stop_codon:yes gene_type:complete
MKANLKKYADLLVQAENARERIEAISLIKKAAKLQNELNLSS